MPIARFQMQDGRVARFEVPDGTTPEQAQEMIAAQIQPNQTPKTSVAEQIANDPISQAAREGGTGTGFQNFAAGAGKAFTDLGRGAAQMVGLGPSREEMSQIQQQDKPLMNTGAGLAGNITGGVAATIPAMAIPGVNTYAGMGALGGAIGALNPVSGDESRLGNIGTGAALGVALPAAFRGAAKAGGIAKNVIDPWLPGGVDRAVGRTANAAAGQDKQAIIQALKNPQTMVPGSAPTAGQAAAPIGRAEFSGLQEAVKGRVPTAYDDIAQAQNAARVKALRTVGQDKQALEKAIKNRATTANENYGAVEGLRVNPASDVQIMQSAIDKASASKGEALRDWGRFATTEAENNVRASNFYPVSGMPRVSGRVSNFPERAAEGASAAADATGIASYRQAQANFLENAMESLKNTVGLDTKSLNDFVNRPSMRSAMKDALLSAQERGTYFPAAKGEQFSVSNLQRIKESLDAGILAAKKSTDAGRRPELSPAELESTKQQFVAWLSNKVPGWADARLQYAADSVPINQMQVGQYLEGKLVPALNDAGASGSQRSAAYAQALRDAPGTLKRATGQPRYEELGQVLNPAQMDVVSRIGSDLARDATHQRLAKAGSEKASELIGQVTPKVPSAGMFNPHYSVLRAIINRLEGKVEGKSLDRLAEAMQNPQELSKIMEGMSPKARSAIAKALREMRPPAVGGTVYAIEQGQQ